MNMSLLFILLLTLLKVSISQYAACSDITDPAICSNDATRTDSGGCCQCVANCEGCGDRTCPTPAPVTPAPVTPAPVTPAPVTPAPVTPAPVTPQPTICYCSTETPVTTAFSTPSPTTKSYAKKTKSSKGSSTGIGFGDCDCDKDYGVVELRFIYQGSDSNNQGSVNIDIFDKEDLKICAFEDVEVDEEIICTIEGNQGGSGKTDFDTETYIDIIDNASGNMIYTGDSFHTSCSSDIVGLTIYDDSIISSGWKDGNPNDNNDCDDGQEECSCETQVPVTTAIVPSTTCYCSTDTPVTTAFSTPSPTTKSYAKKTKSSKGSSTGIGFGDCDCDKDYGVVELRFIYQGSDSNNQGSVDIDIFDKEDLKICAFENVAVDDEIVCTIEGNQGGSGKTDFDTETYIDIIDNASGNMIYTGDSFHTSCSSDIVGLTIYDDSIISSGWKDGNPNDDNDCDDGQEECDCETQEPVTTKYVERTRPPEETEPATTEERNQYCYCQNDLFGSTPSPVSSSKKSKGAKSKGGKSKGSKSSSSSGMGYGDCDCDKDYGMVELRVLYSGSETVTIQWFDKGGDDQICNDSDDVESGQEAICNVNDYPAGGYSKLETNTFAKLVDSNGDEVCTTEIHTSCSRDIVGTYGDGDCGDTIVVTGWKDGNPNDDNDCDDGYDLCSCENEDGSQNENAANPQEFVEQYGSEYAAYVEQQANSGSNTDGSSDANQNRANLYTFICLFAFIKLLL